MPNSLTVVAYHNGSQYIDGWLNAAPLCVVDTGSDEREYDRLCGALYERPRVNVIRLEPGQSYGCTHAYKLAYETFPFFDGYFFMHDSMKIKRHFLPAYEEAAFASEKTRWPSVAAWIGFPMDLGAPESEEAQWIERVYGKIDSYFLPATAIFGPIFYATNQAMRQAMPFWPPPLQNRHELCGVERGLAITFQRAGYKVAYFEDYSNERLDVLRDYYWFDKFRPNRP